MANDLTPSPNGGNGGRNERGQFVAGNPGGPGNPYARRSAELRRGLLEAVTLQDVQEIAEKLLELAKAGDIDAARLLLDRLLGKPVQPVVAEIAEPGVIVPLSEIDDPRLDNPDFLEWLERRKLAGWQSGVQIVGRVDENPPAGGPTIAVEARPPQK